MFQQVNPSAAFVRNRLTKSSRGVEYFLAITMDRLRKIVAENASSIQLCSLAKPLGAPESLNVTGLSGSLTPIVLANLHENTARQLLIVAGDPEAAGRLVDDLQLMFDESAVRIFRGEQGHVDPLSEVHGNLDDIETLRSLVTEAAGIIVTHPQAILRILPPPSSLKNRAIVLEVGKSSSFPDTVRQLAELGFSKVDFVESVGDYSVRGGILDVFPFVGEHPVRTEYLGDTIESIREFDPLSQRSIKELSTATIVPDLLATRDTQSAHAAGRSTLIDYIQPHALIVLDEPERIFGAMERESEKSSKTGIETKEIEELIALFPCIHIKSLHGTAPGAIDFAALPQPSFNGSVRTLRDNLTRLQKIGTTVFVTCDSHSELNRLKELLTDIEPVLTDEQPDAEGEAGDHGFDLAAIEFSLHSFHGGFILPDSRIAMFTEHQIFNRLKRRGRRRKTTFKGLTERDLHQLHKGDYVVHADYGIGRFDGLKKIHVRHVEQEVVKLLYEENDTLYVNLNYINKVQKYSSREGHIPKLTRLGSPDWERLKSKAKKRIKDIARDLIQLYARRKHTDGFAFPGDTAWQKELEASFVYEDTPDQTKATLDIKHDMEASHPMDRLVCGDVGFGKTEVAVRAAFKAVLSGKQVAVLAPTTILALQHYNTFLDRTSRYGLHIEVLSRFKSKKEQTAITAQLKAGTIDIIIGTHRLLSKDVGFKDLGLLIIDEEHRFGVTAKEKLRQLRVQIDTLTLTATPIPRTLHFSLMGARDLSIMATPPRNRLPIITEITHYNEERIRDAVLREIHRGGQVYFVHDRIQRIEEITLHLRSILPQVRIRYAHGQMHAHELEEAMMAFLEKKFDVLVCTKIIESGLDIPNVNTIIINRADRFGMAELYQLRGRVGRSNVQAYAYLLTAPVSVLPKHAIQRLQAVEEFTELGSGFNLAMRDLEIRGAGSMLGGEQSGYIETMGFETYTKILEEAVSELKNQEFQDLFGKQEAQQRAEIETVVDADVEALIPESYISNDVERLGIYRQLYSVTTGEQLSAIRLELRDRFGQPPISVEDLLSVVNVRILAGPMGFRKVVISRDRVEIEFPPASEKQFYEGDTFQHLMNHISRMGKEGVFLKQTASQLKLTVNFPKRDHFADALQLSTEFLVRLRERMEEMSLQVASLS